jgi:phosphate starvation-inducible PhoH-like protein
MVKNIIVEDQNVLLQFLGTHDENLRYLQQNSGSRISLRGNELTISGDTAEVERIEGLVAKIVKVLSDGRILHKQDFEYMVEHGRTGDGIAEIDGIFQESIHIPKSHKVVSARTRNQMAYLRAIRKNDVVVGVGPAGTGKTYLAMAYALEMLLTGKYKKVILTRPVVEAGENLGFLPGTLEEKIHPYLRPLYDAIFDMIDYDKFQKLAESGAIEIAPLAYMRGRTLHNAFVILDEAQNTGSTQMKMFLTRLGLNSRMVITGDISQIDLPRSLVSGLVEVLTVLKDINGIEIIRFGEDDVVRHPLVKKIVRAYDLFGRPAGGGRPVNDGSVNDGSVNDGSGDGGRT